MGKNYEKLVKETVDYYGYPKCCVEQFFKDSADHISPAKVRKVYKNGKLNCSGFIPCYECLKKVKEGECELKNLISEKREIGEFQEVWLYF